MGSFEIVLHLERNERCTPGQPDLAAPFGLFLNWWKVNVAAVSGRDFFRRWHNRFLLQESA
jgi:hypothetical protein